MKAIDTAYKLARGSIILAVTIEVIICGVVLNTASCCDWPLPLITVGNIFVGYCLERWEHYYSLADKLEAKEKQQHTDSTI